MINEPWVIKLSCLDKRVKAFTLGYRQNIALLGGDKEEISYLLTNYLKQNKSEELTYLYASSAYAGGKEFFKAIAFSLLSDYTRKSECLDSLINYASPVLISTTNFIKDCLKKEKLCFLDVLEIINKFINESNRSCVLIIEEFLNLPGIFDNFYQDFSKFIILQRNCMIVLTTSNSRDAEKVLSGELNLLFGNFEKVFLDENSSLVNYFYLKDLIAPLSPSPLFLSFFVNIIGANISYYSLIAEIIKKNYFDENDKASIVSIAKEALYLKETYLFQKFIKKIDFLKFYFKNPTLIIKLLFALSQGYLRKKELASLSIYNPGELTSRLQKLLDLNYIENLGNIYKLKDSLFSFWLTSVFKLYFSPPVLDPQQKNALFEKDLEEKIILFKEEFTKDKLKKIMQLFSSFKNDTLRLGKNRYQLPAVENAKIISYPTRDFHLLIGEGKEIIFAGIKEKNVEDNDIFDFIEKGCNIKGKRVKKIFISLDSLPPTARLIAKNNKLTIWDINEINRLLCVYNKPVVSCAQKQE
ncbi:MAG: hypothetical protein KAT96_02175 [Candidatus Omnitrophica bacterium]|nr:hypothetical protein [Candidatus Omnitrophota bacterium]